MDILCFSDIVTEPAAEMAVVVSPWTCSILYTEAFC